MAVVDFKNGINAVDIQKINGKQAFEPGNTRQVDTVNTIEWPRLYVDITLIKFDSAGDLITASDIISLTANRSWTAVWTVGDHFTATAYSGAGYDYITIACVDPNMGAERNDTLVFYLDGVQYASVAVTQYGI